MEFLTMNTNELQSYFAQQIKEDRNQTQGLSSLINTQQDEKARQYCYKPYRTLKNYQRFTMIDFLTKVLFDFCTLHNLEHLSADDLLYESNSQTMDCHQKLTSEQEEWLSCYIKVWDLVVNNDNDIMSIDYNSVHDNCMQTFIPNFHD